MRFAAGLLILALFPGCASTDSDAPVDTPVVDTPPDSAISTEVPEVLRTRQADRRRLLALVKGRDTHVVVISGKSAVADR